jgi:hypothetical protein
MQVTLDPKLQESPRWGPMIEHANRLLENITREATGEVVVVWEPDPDDGDHVMLTLGLKEFGDATDADVFDKTRLHAQLVMPDCLDTARLEMRLLRVWQQVLPNAAKTLIDHMAASSAEGAA